MISAGSVKDFGTTLIHPGESWFSQRDLDKATTQLDESIVTTRRNQATKLLEYDTNHYNKFKWNASNSSQFRWIDMVRQKGTVQDKMTARSMLLQNSAVHNINTLDDLINAVNVRSKHECKTAMASLVQLFLETLLPRNSVLIPFEERPLNSLDISSMADCTRLLRWYFEDLLRSRYENFLRAIEKVGFDTVEALKFCAVGAFKDLLDGHPQHEQFLVTRLVNKMGDPSSSVAARVAHHLEQLCNKNVSLRMAIVSEVERMLFRSNVLERTQYYALCFLSTLVLHTDEVVLVTKLVNIYLDCFGRVVKQGEAGAKMMKILLTGLYRAHVFLPKNESCLDQAHIDTIFTLVHLSTFNISVQALALLLSVTKMKEGHISDRFYSALYKKLFDPELLKSQLLRILFNTLFKALVADTQERRVKSFIKRLLQVALQAPNEVACSITILVCEVVVMRDAKLARNTSATTAVTKQWVEDDNAEEHYDDVDEESDATVAVKKNGVRRWVRGWTFEKGGNQQDGQRQERTEYDPHLWNPLYARGDLAPLYETTLIAKHFHPSVALFAQKIISHQSSGYHGDPFLDFTLSHFLDRFVYRNPKKIKPVASNSVLQEAFGKTGIRRLLSKQTLLQGTRQWAGTTFRPDEKFISDHYNMLVSAKEDEEEDEVISVAGSDDLDQILEHCDIGEDLRMDFEGDFKSHVDRLKQSKKTKGFVDGDEDFGAEDNNEEFDSGEDDEFSHKSENWKFDVNKGFNMEELLTSAEDFSAIMEDSSRHDMSTLNALSGSAETHVKQLAWEKKRMGADFRKRRYLKEKKKWVSNNKKFSKPAAINDAPKRLQKGKFKSRPKKNSKSTRPT